MEEYIGVKIVQAEPQLKNYGPPETHGQPGYKIIYKDGYTSWCPEDAFKAYRKTSAATYGLAIEALKIGHRAFRAGWNGKNMFIFLMAEKHSDPEYMLDDVFSKDMGVNHSPYIAIKTANNKIVPWTPSQEDMLTDDWVIVK